LERPVVDRQGCPRRSVDCQPPPRNIPGNKPETTVQSRGMFLGSHSEVDGSRWEWPMGPPVETTSDRGPCARSTGCRSGESRWTSPPAHFLDRDSPTSGPSCRSTAVLVG